MRASFIQPTFSSGELCPNLYARVDLAKYHAGLKLARNFFILPQGGASNRAGTMFCGRSLNSIVGNSIGGNLSAVSPQLIPFIFSTLQTYVLEFGNNYMRVLMNGGYVLETPVLTGSVYSGIPITGMTNANPGMLTVNYAAANYPSSAAYGPFSNGDQVCVAGTGTALDSTPGRQYLVANATATTFTLTDLDGNAINTTSYGSITGASPTVARVFTMWTPYAGTDVALIKWTQSADTLTLCHPSYPPQDVTRSQHWIWSMNEVAFAPSISPPTGLVVTPDVTTPAPIFKYSYVVTAVGNNPPSESFACAAVGCSGVQLNSNTGDYNNLSWNNVTGAQYFRIYKANPTVNVAVPAGCMYGYIGTAYGTSFTDVEIAPDFTQTPPLAQDPFNAGPITNIVVLNGGSGYDANASCTVSDVSGTGAVLYPVIVGGVIQYIVVENGGTNYQNPTIIMGNQGINAVGHITVGQGTGFGGGGMTVTAVLTNGGSDYYGKVTVTTAAGTGYKFTAVLQNGSIRKITCTKTGSVSGYVNGAALIFSQHSGSGAAFNIGVTPAGNYPSCATYFQQRKVFGGSALMPQTLWMTKPADFHSMDISNPSQASDAITATIASNQVNAIQWLVAMNNLVIMSAGGAWLLVGGAITSPVAVTPSNCVVVPQNYIGCAANVMPIVINYDILYIQAKGSICRDLAYNYWVNVYTGQDVSVLSSHLFFGHNILRWCYAEQPFYQIWAVRDDGWLLSFAYLKEQEVQAWAHSDSFGNSGTDKFTSVASIPEQQVAGINMDSVYLVVQRTIPGINSGNPVFYIERMDGRNFLTNGESDVTKCWFVDSGLQYNGSPTTTVTGLDHLNGAMVSVLADGSTQPSFLVTNGAINLQYAASLVTVGLPFQAQLQSLCLEPEQASVQVQDYRKKVATVTLRVSDSRGLKVGPDFTSLTELKERSASVYMGAAIPLFTGDERVEVTNKYVVDDDVCIQQDNPLPCTVLGIIPEVQIGDNAGGEGR